MTTIATPPDGVPSREEPSLEVQDETSADRATGERWYAIHFLPRAEATAERNLVRQGYEVFIPWITTSRRHARRQEVVRVAFFPRYGFVKLDLECRRWRPIKGTTGVSGLVMGGDRPKPVPEGIVEDLIGLVGPDGTIDPDWGFRPGDNVRLRHGPFSGQIGVLQRLDGRGRADMLLSLMGGNVKLRVARSVLEPVR